jgi:hypothetical protein
VIDPPVAAQRKARKFSRVSNWNEAFTKSLLYRQIQAILRRPLRLVGFSLLCGMSRFRLFVLVDSLFVI